MTLTYRLSAHVFAALVLATSASACDAPADASVDGSSSDAASMPDAGSPACDAIGFATAPVEWTLPQDGLESFPSVGDRNATAPNYAVVDLTGDGRVDLVVTEGFGTSSTQWQVYPGTASGFSAEVIAWALPDFGPQPDDESWLVELNDRFANGLNYGVLDMTGDGAPDLVVTERDLDVIAGPDPSGLGSRVWLVFDNTGSGFDTSGREWTLPQDGLESFPSVGDRNATAPNYAVVDLTGDGRVDLVVTEGFGTSSTQWQVYPGTASGFSAEVIAWALPDFGPQLDEESWLVELNDRFANGLNYGVLDMTGDGAPDLVVTERDLDVIAGPDPSGLGSRVWLVFDNTGSGFDASGREWTLPQDGLESFPSVGDRNATAPNYAVIDLTGDGRVDLVVTEGFGTSSTQWQVYPGTASGFSADVIAWTLPDFGPQPDEESWLVELNDRFANGLNYGVLDMTGDGAPDLVVTERDLDVIAGPDPSGLGSRVWLMFGAACRP